MSNELSPVVITAAVHPMRPVTQWTTMLATVATTSHQTTSMSHSTSCVESITAPIANLWRYMTFSLFLWLARQGDDILPSIYQYPLKFWFQMILKNASCCSYIFTNVSNVGIKNVTIYFLSLSFGGEGHLLEAKHVDFHGYSCRIHVTNGVSYHYYSFTS